MKKYFIILILFCISFSLKSQSYNSNFNQFEFKSHFGFTIPHHQKLKYLINSNIFIGELNYSVKTDGSKSWHHTWRFPEIGVGYLMGGLGNINVFGFSQSLYFFYGIPIIENDNLLFKYRMGTGVAFLSDKFDVRSNHYNIAIGSHFNAHLHFAFLVDYKPLDIPLYLSGGITFNHFSNGAVETPNLGLNQITCNLGVKYLYSEYIYSLPKRTKPYMYNSEFELSAYYAAALKENSTYENKKHFINTLIIDAALRVSKKRSFGFGINIISDPSLQTLQGDDYKNISDIFRFGIHALQELYLTDGLSMYFHLGTYLYNPYKPSDKSILVYSKIGVRYTFFDKYFANVALKTHTSVADYIELGIGMRFY